MRLCSWQARTHGAASRQRAWLTPVLVEITAWRRGDWFVELGRREGMKVGFLGVGVGGVVGKGLLGQGDSPSPDI